MSDLQVSKTSKSFFEIFSVHLGLILFSQLVLFILVQVSVYTVTIQSRLPEDFLELTELERKEVQQKLIENYQETLSKEPQIFTEEYFHSMIENKPHLLFWNSFLWGFCFLLPAFIILYKVMKIKISTLDDVFDVHAVMLGLFSGLGVFLVIVILSLILLFFNIKLNPGKFQSMLFENLKGDINLLAWSVYTIGIVTGIVEELFFRGFLLKNYIEKGFMTEGLIITSIIFGSVHYTSEGSIFIPLILTAVGFYFGAIYLITKNIWVNIISHATYNTLGIILAYFIGDKL